MYRKYRIVENIASSVSQYESYRDQVYRYTPSSNVSLCRFTASHIKIFTKEDLLLLPALNLYRETAS